MPERWEGEQSVSDGPDFVIGGVCSVCGDPWPHRDAKWAEECEEIATDA